MGLTSNIKFDDKISKYKYRPLEGETKIRILHLHSIPDQELHCSISHVDIDDGDYTALSYAWGNLKQSSQMVVMDDNNKVEGYIPLTENLRSALENLRDAPEVTQKTFWIDQISINQEDLEERGKQVSFMRQIYTNASMVITYLGPAEVGDDAALELTKILYDLVEPHLEALATAVSWHQSTRQPWATVIQSIPMDHPGWKTLRSLVDGGWLARLWMASENVLNETTVMLRGTKILDWVQIAEIPVLSGMGLLKGTEYAEHDTANAHNPVWIMLEGRLFQRFGWERTTYNLVDMIAAFRSMDYSDPRDGIYALMAFCGESTRLAIKPDYRLSLPEVYLATTAQVIEGTKTLTMLSTTQFGTNPEDRAKDLPTWVSDWRAESNQVQKGESYYSSCKEMEIRGHVSGRELILDGIALDIVTDYNAAFTCGFDAMLFWYDPAEVKDQYDHFKHVVDVVLMWIRLHPPPKVNDIIPEDERTLLVSDKDGKPLNGVRGASPNEKYGIRTTDHASSSKMPSKVQDDVEALKEQGQRMIVQPSRMGTLDSMKSWQTIDDLVTSFDDLATQEGRFTGEPEDGSKPRPHPISSSAEPEAESSGTVFAKYASTRIDTTLFTDRFTPESPKTVSPMGDKLVDSIEEPVEDQKVDDQNGDTADDDDNEDDRDWNAPWTDEEVTTFCQILVGAIYGEDAKVPSPEEFRNMIKYLDYRYCGTLPMDDDGKPRPFTSKEEQDIIAAAGKFADTTCTLMRSFVLTHNNRICLAPSEVKPGDVIVMLFGGRPLYALRPVGDKYQYIGDAAMLNYMNGELVEDPDFESKVRQFVII